jgi:mannosyl-oligosaccharide alpha-1,2-mannosidase
LAETLKYLYLIFAEDAPWQFKANHTNQYVLNTEGHPLRLAKGQESRRRRWTQH